VNLSPHFTLEELTHSDAAARNGWDNTPGENEKANLTRLAALLEQVKTAVGNKPVMINSAFRSKQVNDAVGSKDTSQHRIGCAADLRVPGMTPREVVLACIGAGLPFDQIILEFDAWTHISVPNEAGHAPRGSRLIIDKQGTRVFT
jgi:zinc D-Ala-D-Ala carboxypeptidase